ncbi:MAG: hypothetical protein IH991_21180 [Planctomycetes bacterium]|nr:hypothetical protein [Planctomycetota bacterium]
MVRTKTNQSSHDVLVRKLAKQLENAGHTVSADVSGYAKPKTFYGMRPDIIAEKNGKRRIVEVETPDSLNTARDLKQKKIFAGIAKRSEKTTFMRKVTK